MSHSQTIKVLVTNKEALEATAREMNAQSFSTEIQDVKMYDGTYRGMFIHFQNWKYPTVISDGELRYDSYNGSWGNEKDLQAFRQNYAANVVRIAGLVDGKTLVSDTGVRAGSNRIVVLDNGDGSHTQATIPEEGDAVLEVVGCAGNVCHSHTSAISSALGMSTGDVLLPEYEERERLREREQE